MKKRMPTQTPTLTPTGTHQKQYKNARNFGFFTSVDVDRQSWIRNKDLRHKTLKTKRNQLALFTNMLI